MLVTFIICLIFICYVYLGYPFLLWLLSRNIEKSYPEKQYQGDISIVMVVCNEEKHIADKIVNIKQLHYSGGRLNIIIVDDCSDDDTVNLVLSSDLNCRLIRSDKRLGKAHGINLAMTEVTTELVLFIDCRQQLDLYIIEHLSSWFADNPTIGAISGELMFKVAKGNDFSAAMDGYWRYEKFIRKSEALLASVPGVTGALYMLRANTFKAIPNNTLLDDVQIPMVTAGQGYRVGFDDRAIAWDEPSTCLIKERARKIRTLGGNYQLLLRFPQWVFPFGHPISWQFFSHKIARLLVPFVISTSAALAMLLIDHYPIMAIGYLLVILSSLLLIPLAYIFPAVRKIKLLKLVESFILLNWFCLLAFFNYFFIAQAAAWKK